MLLIVILLSFVAVLFSIQKVDETSDRKVKIAVSTFALYDIAKSIGGEEAEVKMVIPFGVEVHSFEPTPKTIIEIQKSTLFLFSGAALEPWVKKLPRTDNMRDMSRYVDLKKVVDHNEEHHEEEHHHGAFDPHYWLDIGNMKLLTQKLALELVKLDPPHEPLYIQRAEAYMDELNKIDSAYKKRLKTCKLHEVIVHHNTLGYVATRYGFEVEALTGLSPDALADAKTMARLAKSIKEKGIDVLFFEAFVSDRLMKNLAKENNIRLDYLEPLANITAIQAEEGMRYQDGMYENLEKLSKAMQCQ